MRRDGWLDRVFRPFFISGSEHEKQVSQFEVCLSSSICFRILLPPALSFFYIDGQTHNPDITPNGDSPWLVAQQAGAHS